MESRTNTETTKRNNAGVSCEQARHLEVGDRLITTCTDENNKIEVQLWTVLSVTVDDDGGVGHVSVKAIANRASLDSSDNSYATFTKRSPAFEHLDPSLVRWFEFTQKRDVAIAIIGSTYDD